MLFYDKSQHEELNKLTAYNKGEPIMSKVGWASDYTLATYLIKRTLLDIGGEDVKFPYYEEDYVAIQTRGQLWLSDRVKFDKGHPNQCHKNSALLWYENQEHSTIMIGYALYRGIWYQHSWVIHIKPDKNVLYETTVPYDRYFGFAMTQEECLQFYYDNI